MANNFRKLTPTDEMELGIYKEALDYVFVEADIKNIAVSGAYGAGKSSVIETYKKQSGKNFIHISLAHFKEAEQISSEPGEADAAQMMEAQLEGKIINQLIHQIDPEQIPLTNFKIKSNPDEKMLRKYTACGVLSILLTIFILSHEKWNVLLVKLFGEGKKWYHNFLSSEWFVVLAGALLIFLMGGAIHTLVKMQAEKKMLKKIVFKDTEIEILQECKDSFFDSYLNEVLYLFEHSGADAIVFEDMDRYGSNTIFTKLREIRTLLGDKNKSLKFIYLLRDDIFGNSDRTKFFDFIIPVVPVIDSSNSYNKILNHFQKIGIKELFSEEFLKEISIFIDDMRILENIQNEFLVYKTQIVKMPEGYDFNKMLAMIVYKNLFPKDFGELQLRHGYVYHLFASKECICQSECSQLEARVREIDSALIRAAEEVCHSVEELDALYFSTGKKLRVNYKTENSFTSRVEFVKTIKENLKNVEEQDSYYVNEWDSYDPTSIFKKMEASEEYKQRKENIELNSQTKKAKLLLEKKQCEERLQVLRQAELKEIINDDNQAAIFGTKYLDNEDDFKLVRQSPYFSMIQYLIREGYLDETYTDYMTYFYEDSIKAEDRAFLRNVFSGKQMPYHYQLNNPKKVIADLALKYYSRKIILNNDLLDELLKNENLYEEPLSLMMHQIYEKKETDFVAQYLANGKMRQAFVKKMNQGWSEMCEWIFGESKFVPVQALYILDTLKMCSSEVVRANDESGVITRYLEQNIAAIDVTDEEVANIMEGIKILDVKVKNIDLAVVNPQLLEEIYHSYAYVLNAEMIELFYKYFYRDFYEGSNRDSCGKFSMDEYPPFEWSKALTCIFAEKKQMLARYIDSHLDEAANIIMNKTEIIRDDEIIILKILNASDLADATKHAYLQCTKTMIHQLSDVSDKKLWPMLMKNKLLVSSSENVCDYYFTSGNKLDEHLISYINQSENSLTIKNIALDEIYGEEAKSNFFESVVACNELENAKYEDLVVSCKMYYLSFDVSDMQSDKMQILLRTKVIRATKENIEFLREEYPEHMQDLIKYDLEDYLQVVRGEDTSQEEDSSQGEDGSQEEIFREEEIPYVLEEYPSNDVEVNQAIVEIVETHIAYILEEKIRLNEELRNEVLKAQFLDEEQAKKMIAICLPEMKKAEIVDAFRDLKFNEFLGLFEGKRPLFKQAEENIMLLDALQNAGWISSYEKDKQKVDYIRAYGKKKIS